MPQYMKKGSLGRMVIADGGYSDPELAEVRLSPEEYEDLLDEIRDLKRERDSARQETQRVRARGSELISEARHNAKISAKEEAERRVSEAIDKQREAEKVAGKARELVAEKEAELEKAWNLNNNLRRIARERANQQRGLTPKKDHDGYLVLSSRQWVEHYTYEYTDVERNMIMKALNKNLPDPYIEHKTADAWKSVIQTPYDASLPLNQVKDEIFTDLCKRVLGRIGFKRICGKEEDMGYQVFKGEDENGVEREVNGLYRWIYRANYKAGFWELELFHTKSLRVPPEYRPRY